MRLRVWWIAAIACTIALVTLLLRGHENRPAAQNVGIPSAKNRNTSPVARSISEASISDASSNSAPTVTRATVSTPTSPLRSATKLRRLPMEILKECFLAEPRDDAWSQLTERRLREFITLQPHSAAFRVISVECRATLCEIHTSTENPVELNEGPTAPETWESLMNKIQQDRTLAQDFEDDGVLLASSYGETANYTTTLVRKLSDDAPDDARCGHENHEALNLRALKFITEGRVGDTARGLPPLSDEIKGSAFKLAVYFDAEDRDEKWANAMEAAVRTAFSEQTATRTWREPFIECKETLCQIRVSTPILAIDDLRRAIEKVTSTTKNLGMTRIANELAVDPTDLSLVSHNVILIRTR
jgi:hypothetical protein